MTLVAFRAGNHPQQVARNGAKSDLDDRRTPPELIRECLDVAGVDGLDLDVAATAENAVATDWIDAESDAMQSPWWGRVWCNPPYSSIEPWVCRAWDQWAAGRCEAIVMLLPANRTEQRWWQESVEPYRIVGMVAAYFLAGRRRFDRPGWVKPAKGDRPPFGLCVLAWTRS